MTSTGESQEPYTEVAITPLGEISMSFVTCTVVEGWVTAPRVVLEGRREMNINNTSSDYEIHLSNVSPSSVYRTLDSKQDATFKVDSETHIFMRAYDGTVRVEVTEIR